MLRAKQKQMPCKLNSLRLCATKGNKVYQLRHQG